MRVGFTLRAILALVAAVAWGAARAATPLLELDVDLDPGARRLKAAALLQPVTRDFRFRLHETLKVTASSADGRVLTVARSGHEGTMNLWRVQVPAGTGALRVEYEGTLPALDRALDHRGVLQGLPPMASDDGSFLPASGAWYPQPATPFAYRVRLSVPANQRALVPGRLMAEETPTDGRGRYRASFEFLHPAVGIDLMAGPWVVREKSVPRAAGGKLRLRTYFFRDLDAIPGLAEGYLDDAQRYIERFGGEIGAYPFTEFSVVASPLPTGFGMPTLTDLGADVLKLPFIRATSLGHEVLHNWWGNGVYVDDAGGNWSEGLTTFMADYAFKEGESAGAAREMRLAWLRDFGALPASDRETLASFRSRAHGAAAAVGYGKSAMLFVMLKDAIGDDAFRRGIRAFWEKHRFRAASWGDLQAAFEQASHRRLAPFFAQWIERAGGPAVSIARAEAKPDGRRFRVTLEVLQSAPAYALRLPLEVVYPGRSEIRWIETGGLHDRVVVDLEARPDGVRVDPDLRVWRVLDREQLPPILRQWAIARAPRLAQASAAGDVRDAADTLAKRFFENAAQPVSPAALDQGAGPVMLAGLPDDVDRVLAGAGLPPRPAGVARRGSAQVWTVARGAGPPVMVVSAGDADALRALSRPLPHYGGQSWLVFEGARALERGIWPARVPLTPVESAR